MKRILILSILFVTGCHKAPKLLNVTCYLPPDHENRVDFQVESITFLNNKVLVVLPDEATPKVMEPGTNCSVQP